jgi:protein-L-isoaspartate(D-aspartate) O-methyltransferase
MTDTGNRQEKDFSELRQRMVETQLLKRGINDRAVLCAFRRVPRHKFVPRRYINESYADYPLSIGSGQTISQPYIVALMTQCLQLKPTDRVLEVGLGSGYQAAILAEIVLGVYTLERITVLAQGAQKRLEDLGYHNIEVKIGNGVLGWPQNAPFDAIIVTAATAQVPAALLGQLRAGGRMAIPLGGRFSQVLTVLEKQAQGRYKRQEICGCVFVPLVDKPAQ